MSESHITGCLLGTALGDAIGLPYEGLLRRRAARLLGPPTRHRFIFGRGMLSDDTEHSCMVAQALISSGGQPAEFIRHLARSMRWWLLGLPAGIGMAALKAIVKLWFGVSPNRSGIFSAGNGPAMRSALLGAAIDDLDLLQKLVAANTRLTHSDPRAEQGALAVALAAWSTRQSPIVSRHNYLELLAERIGTDAEMVAAVRHVTASVERGETTTTFAASIGQGKGVSGYVLHTVPVALHAWLAHPRDLRRAIVASVECGGDSDTVAAITGGIVGCAVGREGLPTDWLATLKDWPRSATWIERLGAALASSLEGDIRPAPRLSLVGLVLRNLLFLIVVVGHGFRRLLPPYQDERSCKNDH